MNEEHGSPNMMWLLGQFLATPLVTLVYGVEVFLQVLQGMQKATNQSIEAVAGPNTSAAQSPAILNQSASTVFLQRPTSNTNGISRDGTNNEEEKRLSYDNNQGNGLDKNLRDDMLKLVRYKILFVKREYEHAFPEQEDLVYDNMDGNSFTAWKVAEFIQDLARQRDPAGRAEVNIRVPHKWKKYPANTPEHTYTEDGYLLGLPHDDKKYLRVFYQVLERYPREKFRHDERQIEVLEEIRDRIGSKAPGSTP